MSHPGLSRGTILAGVPAGIPTADARRRRDTARGGARSGPQAHPGRGLAPDHRRHRGASDDRYVIARMYPIWVHPEMRYRALMFVAGTAIFDLYNATI